MAYIKVPAVYTKLKRAEQSFRPVMMLAHAGWGKTSAVKYYYRNKSVLWLSGLSGALDSMPEPATIRQGVVIIDDLSQIEDPASENYIRNLLHKNDRQLVLMGRGNLPAWLSGEVFSLEFVYITEKDLTLDEKQIASLFESSDITLSDEQAEMLRERLLGYPPALKLCLIHAEQGEPITEALLPKIRIDLFHYYEKAVYNLWQESMKEFLLSVCQFPDFTSESAALLSGRQDVQELLLYCHHIGSFLERKGSNHYTIIQDLREFLCWKQELEWPQARILDNYCKGADDYMQQGRISDALYYYDRAGAVDKIRNALIENAYQHPGVGQYYALRNYYEELPPEMIRRSPALMAGMSVLYSMTLRREKSEKWYSALMDYVHRPDITEEERREAKARLAYLDIGLVHRSGNNLTDVIQQVYALQQEEGFVLPELSVTDNSPSLMNSGLDFCEWAKDAEEFLRASEKPLEMLLSDFGKGLANVALAEVGFEHSTMSSYEVTTRLNHAFAAADQGGKIEMCFAAQGVLIRQHVAQGHLHAAQKALKTILQKAETEGAKQLLANIEALSVWLSFYAGDTSGTSDFMDSIPDPHIDFYTLNRFRYMVKLRCFIAREEYAQAVDISGYLEHYFLEYGRIYHQVENHLLRAIVLYRTGQPQWQEVLLQALVQAEEYHLTRVISMEGAAILPLLTELKSATMAETMEKARPQKIQLQKIMDETRHVALLYPDYLKHAPKISVNLTAREQEILGLLCAGKTMDEICEQCKISYSGLKKHNRNIYSKLGVKTRAEAERSAVRMGITHRKEG